MNGQLVRGYQTVTGQYTMRGQALKPVARLIKTGHGTVRSDMREAR